MRALSAVRSVSRVARRVVVAVVEWERCWSLLSGGCQLVIRGVVRGGRERVTHL